MVLPKLNPEVGADAEEAELLRPGVEDGAVAPVVAGCPKVKPVPVGAGAGVGAGEAPKLSPLGWAPKLNPPGVVLEAAEGVGTVPNKLIRSAQPYPCVGPKRKVSVRVGVRAKAWARFINRIRVRARIKVRVRVWVSSVQSLPTAFCLYSC